MVSWLDRPDWSRERAIIAYVQLGHRLKRHHLAYLEHEFSRLAEAAGFNSVAICKIQVRAIHPKYFIGSGKAFELRKLVEQEKATIVLIDAHLSGTQERQLESQIGCRLLDRTALILDIFAQRARSREGILEVRLAQYQYASTRAVHGWTHLERQAGAARQRGPGEQQVELDRRLIQRKIKDLKDQLAVVHRQQRQTRAQRISFSWPIVALVGYTNAGKTTLFQRLTEVPGEADDRLFMTLDPRVRRFNAQGKRLPIFISDTVGFIRDLPHELVAAFRATLLEVKEADLLIRVEDSSDPMQLNQREAVDRVLEEIGVFNKPQLWVGNKSDISLEKMERWTCAREETLLPKRIALSARFGDDLDTLVSAIVDELHRQLGFACYQFLFKETIDAAACIKACYQTGWVERLATAPDRSTVRMWFWQTQRAWEKLRTACPSLVRYLVQVGTNSLSQLK